MTSSSEPRVAKDPYLYGVEYRCVDGDILQWRHTPPGKPKGEWRPLTEERRGLLVCNLGWTPGRLRVWAGLLERPNRRRATMARRRSA